VTVALPLTFVTCVVAVMVAWVEAGTAGAVNCPDDDMTPMLLVQFTVVVTMLLAVAVQRLFCRDWMTAGVQETVMLVTGVTVIVAVALLEVSWTEMAVMVTGVEPVTGWPANRPLTSMVPALAAQETSVLNVPVPVTVAVQVLVWPDWTEVGLQLTETPVIVLVLLLLLPPPQAMMPSSAAMARSRARARKLSPRRRVGAARKPRMIILTRKSRNKPQEHHEKRIVAGEGRGGRIRMLASERHNARNAGARKEILRGNDG